MGPILSPNPGVAYPQTPMYPVSPVGNQISPNQLVDERRILEDTLKTTKSKTVRCPYCNTVNPTRVETSCNCCMCLATCLCVSICIGICLVLACLLGGGQSGGGNLGGNCGNTDCEDVRHYCSNCNQLLYTYTR